MALFICYSLYMSELNDLIGDYPAFLDDIFGRVVQEGFDLDDFVQVDHMCYRTTSTENYLQKQAELKTVASLLGETMINGRPISTFRLNRPVLHDPWRIDAIELPAPKSGAQHVEGLEHVEFVLYDDIPTFLKKYESKPFEMRAADRGINPEIGLQLGEYSVKFHLLNLTTVVYLEHKLGMNDIKDGQ
ncbi:MAG TPA: VOC family protein [Candidatus Saccharimonadia bacterium]|nr:VOC family protein [Candidatus Saccharimonadia bacterium]